MSTSICVLPAGIIETLTAQLNEEHPAVNGLAFIRLPHPRTGFPGLFLPRYEPDGSTSSILELQDVSPNASRSWFNGGEVIADGSLKLLTPIDPAFLLLPLLRAAYPNGAIGNFRQVDDILEEAATKLVGVSDTGQSEAGTELCATDIMELGRHSCILQALRRICEVKDIASDLIVYRYSESNFLDYLSRKAERLSRTGILNQSRTLQRELAKDGLFDDGKEALLQSGWLKLACDTISQYIPSEIYQLLLAKFDFSALDAHVEALNAATMAVSESQNSKNANTNGDAKEQDAKKRKAAGQASRGVEKLKKVNVKGMAKLSTFFQKAKA